MPRRSRSPGKKRSPKKARSRGARRSRPRSLSRSRGSRSRSRTRSPKKRGSPRKRSGCRGVKPVTTVKLCGPRKSCKYPKVYSRRELLVLAKREGMEDAENKSKNQLCSRLALRKIKQFSKLRLIEGRICGPEKSSKYKKTKPWTKNELIDALSKQHGRSPSSLRNQEKEDLCVLLYQLNYAKNKKVKRDVNLNDVDYNEDLSDFDYTGLRRILPFFYYLVHNYKNFCLYLKPKYTVKFYQGIRYEDCDTVIIEDDVLSFLQNCKKRFAFVMIKIVAKDSDAGHINFMLYDKQQKTIEQFEPLGTYFKCDKTALNIELEALAFKLGAKYIPNEEFCPTIGPQKVEASQRGQYFHAKDNPGGFCAIWNIWTIEMRLRHPNKSLEEILRKGIDLLKLEGRGASNYILRYMAPKLRLAPELKLEAKKVGQPYGIYIYNLLTAELKGR